MKRPGRGLFVERNAADRVHPKYYDVIITIAEAARLVDVSTPTIRSWILRGHLTPTEGSEPRAVRLRVEDVVRAAQARAVPARIPARRRIRAR